MKRVYISGPITGMPGLNRDAFGAAAEALAKLGLNPINPFDVCPDPVGWTQAMRADIKALMDCDVIVMLPGWHASRGAKLEHFIAESLGMPVLPLDAALEVFA